MSQENSNNDKTNPGKTPPLSDWADMWKDMYFKTEKSISDNWKEFVGTDTFSNSLNQTIEQYLACNKIARENIEQITEASGYATKKDIARLAELLIAVEEKTDQLESLYINNTQKLSQSMAKMMEINNSLQEQLIKINQRLDSLEQK